MWLSNLIFSSKIIPSSPTLFNLFIEDLMKGTKGDNCKFADYGTLWHKGQDLDCIRKRATEDIETIVEWTRK
jgi:hypothetical protein